MNCCCFLLLLTLTSCLCDDVTQSSYQAEENRSITLEWTFNKAHTSSEPRIVYCCLLTGDTLSLLYHLLEGVEYSEDDQFSGRVQCDRDALREGRVRLHVSRLRTQDSGWYRCQIRIHGQWADLGLSHLNVTAAAAQPETQRPTERPGPESHGGIGLYTALAVAAAVVAAGAAAAGAAVLLVKLCCS